MAQHIEYLYDIDPKKQGFFWPASEQKRLDYFEVKRLRPAEAESVYQCRPGARTGSVFVDADFRYYRAPGGIELGMRSPAIRTFVEGSGGVVAQGWDTGITATSQSDYTACVTVLLVPCFEYHRGEDPEMVGACDAHFDVYVLEVWKAKVEIGDLVAAIREGHQKWRPRIVLIEKKANGTPAMQALANSSIPMEGVTPVESKRDRAVNGGGGAGSVQGWFRSGRVMFPQLESEFDNAVFLSWLPDFIRELKDFTGEKGGRDDQVDAMVHVVGWAIREGGANSEFPVEWQTPAAVDIQMNPGVGHNGGPPMGMGFSHAEALGHFIAAEEQAFDVGRLLDHGLVDNPFDGMCGTCRQFAKAQNMCGRFRHRVGAVHPACPEYDDGFSLSFPR
jgi:predicted phage terminase large subunit-like protein